MVVEDDTSFGQSVTEAIKRAGYDCVFAPNPEQALKVTEHQEFQILIIDCMLPRMNGVDIAQRIMHRADPKPTLILITGIFKDKTFMKEALNKTKAIALLYKPIDLEKLLEFIESQIKENYLDPELEPLPNLLTKHDCSSADITQAFEKQALFPAYHLPLVFSLFAREGMTGELDIISSDRELSKITLLEGKIVDVRSSAASTQMGELLVEFGFVMPEDVEEALEQTNPTLPLGMRLVAAGALSPHAVGLIREEQLAIRLSQLIQNNSIEVTWHKRPIVMKDTYHALPPARLKLLMSEWILSKIPAEFLRSFYLPFAERVIGWRGKGAVKIEGAKGNMPFFQETLERITTQNVTLQDLMVEAGAENDLAFLQAIHTLVLERKVYFGEQRRSADDFQARIKRYTTLLQSFAKKDYFQILGISQKARSSEVHRSYTELAKQFHPDKITPDSPAELKDLCHKIFSQITNAHGILSDDAKRQVYVADLSRKEANRMFALEPMFEKGVDLIKAKKYAQAAKIFDDLIAQKALMTDLKAYSYWARLKSGAKLSDKDFFEIPPEDRHTGVYLLARGLYHKSLRNYQRALECFQQAKLIDKKLSEAQREIVELIDEAGSKVAKNSSFFSRLLGGGGGKKGRRSA